MAFDASFVLKHKNCFFKHIRKINSLLLWTAKAHCGQGPQAEQIHEQTEHGAL